MDAAQNAVDERGTERDALALGHRDGGRQTGGLCLGHGVSPNRVVDDKVNHNHPAPAVHTSSVTLDVHL
jgi:hypothetical protein